MPFICKNLLRTAIVWVFSSYAYYLYAYNLTVKIIQTLKCAAKLYQYAKNATFAPHFHTNFNKTWKRIYISIPIITS